MNTNRCALYNKYTGLETLRFYFENDHKIKRASISVKSEWIKRSADNNNDDEIYDFGRYIDFYVLNCPKCNGSHKLDDLHYMNKKLVCKCGAEYSSEDIAPMFTPYVQYTDKVYHNIANETYRKTNVPTIFIKDKINFYCNKCNKTHDLLDLELKNNNRICTCGNEISFNECKIIGEQCMTYNSSKIFIDGHKISFSFISMFSSATANNQYYWQNGNYRFTMNLDTGFSYISTSGHEYTTFNKVYKNRSCGKNAPKMINCSYGAVYGLSDRIANSKIQELTYKYKEFPNLQKLLIEKRYKLTKHIQSYIFKKIDNYMTDYYNNKFGYKIKSMKELFEEEKTINHYIHEATIMDYFALRNRFINASYAELSDTLLVLIDFSRVYGNKKYNDYKYMPRESNNVALDYICKITNASKGLRKKLSAQMNIDNFYNNKFYQGNKYYAFASIARHIKNKELVNNMYKLIIEDKESNEHYYRNTKAYFYDIIQYWKTFRDDKFLSKLNNKELNRRYILMRDSLRLINNIKEILGDDWDVSSVPFRTEDQYHDDLIKLSNSDLVSEARDKKDNELANRKFKLEDTALKLEEIDNDILIARNRATLTNIGTAMGICVGGYGEVVESGNSRIAYIKTNGEYIACLELRKRGKTADKKGYKYTLVQAKLKYNQHVVTNEKVYAKVLAWCERHNIEIDTCDMTDKNERAYF
jgi:hypothetical protein